LRNATVRKVLDGIIGVTKRDRALLLGSAAPGEFAGEIDE
jgi:hypothetical protein